MTRCLLEPAETVYIYIYKFLWCLLVGHSWPSLRWKGRSMVLRMYLGRVIYRPSPVQEWFSPIVVVTDHKHLRYDEGPIRTYTFGTSTNDHTISLRCRVYLISVYNTKIKIQRTHGRSMWPCARVATTDLHVFCVERDACRFFCLEGCPRDLHVWISSTIQKQRKE